MISLSPLVFPIILLFILFFISRISINKLLRVCFVLLRNSKSSVIVISLILLPGTIIHELSHALMAMILQLKIRDIHIFPEWGHDLIKLGSVVYEKKDVFRSILVGVAPFFVGLMVLWWFYGLGLYQNSSVLQFLGMNYIVFVISTTMFSSKQDLVDILYLIPIIAVVMGCFYIFQIDSSFVIKLIQLEAVRQFLYAIRTYIAIAIGIHAIIILFSTIILSFHTQS